MLMVDYLGQLQHPAILLLTLTMLTVTYTNGFIQT